MGALVNLAQDTLASGIDAIVVVMTLTDASEFPDPGDDGGPYEVIVWDESVNPNPADSPADVEVMIVTGLAGNVMTVTRDNPITHNSGGVTYGVALTTTVGTLRNHGRNDVVAFGAKTDGTTDVSTAVTAAIVANTELYFPPGVYYFASDFTFVRSVRVVCADGVTLRPSATATLHHEGPLIAGRHALFDLDTHSGAAVSFSDFGGHTEVFPEWFGAVADDDSGKATANTTAIQRAWDSIDKTSSTGAIPVTLVSGIYRTDDEIDLSGTTVTGGVLRGVGRGGSMISLIAGAPAATSVIKTSGDEGSIIQGVKLVKEGGTGHCLELSSDDQDIIDDVELDNQSTGATDAALYVNSRGAMLRDIELRGTCGIGIQIDPIADLVTIHGIRMLFNTEVTFTKNLLNIDTAQEVSITGFHVNETATTMDSYIELKSALGFSLSNSSFLGSSTLTAQIVADDGNRCSFINCCFGNSPVTYAVQLIETTGVNEDIRFLQCLLEGEVNVSTGTRGLTFRDTVAGGNDLTFVFASDAAKAATSVGVIRDNTTPNITRGENGLVETLLYKKAALAQSDTDVDIFPIVGNAPFSDYKAAFDGIIVGIAVDMTSAMTAGAIDVKFYVAGSLHSTHTFDNTTNTFLLRTWGSDDSLDFVARGETLKFEITTSATFQTAAGFASTGLVARAYIEKRGEPAPNTV